MRSIALYSVSSGVFSTGATGALAPVILGNILLSTPFSTHNFGTIYYCQHPQFKSPKYATDEICAEIPN